eukprot:comp23751_c3_seq1/m.41042 comp23751_c3_seq1/g.41042  ORF comp23751_c3_seq1/g.41042 comp23751_c3_seq1/m.41042 type:complete len:488 (-) comp23751_c3_seq1:1284-2747(-)
MSSWFGLGDLVKQAENMLDALDQNAANALGTAIGTETSSESGTGTKGSTWAEAVSVQPFDLSSLAGYVTGTASPSQQTVSPPTSRSITPKRLSHPKKNDDDFFGMLNSPQVQSKPAYTTVPPVGRTSRGARQPREPRTQTRTKESPGAKETPIAKETPPAPAPKGMKLGKPKPAPKAETPPSTQPAGTSPTQVQAQPTVQETQMPTTTTQTHKENKQTHNRKSSIEDGWWEVSPKVSCQSPSMSISQPPPTKPPPQATPPQANTSQISNTRAPHRSTMDSDSDGPDLDFEDTPVGRRESTEVEMVSAVLIDDGLHSPAPHIQSQTKIEPPKGNNDGEIRRIASEKVEETKEEVSWATDVAIPEEKMNVERIEGNVQEGLVTQSGDDVDVVNDVKEVEVEGDVQVALEEKEEVGEVGVKEEVSVEDEDVWGDGDDEREEEKKEVALNEVEEEGQGGGGEEEEEEEGVVGDEGEGEREGDGEGEGEGEI